MRQNIMTRLALAVTVIAGLLAAPAFQGQAQHTSSPAVYLPIITRIIPPVARFTVSSASGVAPLDLAFDASASASVDGTIQRYTWDFGDEQPPVSGINPGHTYTQAGRYIVTLTVTDSQGASGQHQNAVEVHSPAFLAKNVIILLGDGMGPEQVRAAGMYLHGAEGTLPFESFPYRARMTTYSASGPITDSAAAATALATGHKVNNGVISQAIPADSSHPYGSDLYTLLEYARDHAMSTGLVTSTFVTDATPAAFGAHTASRTNTSEVAVDYLGQSRPNVLYGGGGSGMTFFTAQAAGYSIATDAITLSGLASSHPAFVSGQFGTGPMPYELDGLGSLPHLSKMATSALDLLDDDPDGFFVLIEGGNIDHAGHANDLPRLLGEMGEFANSVQAANDWAKNRPSTLIIVLADHETGGLSVLRNNGQGILPTVSWSTTSHTATNVTVYLTGPALQNFPTLLDNNQIPSLLTGGQFNP